MTGLALLAFLGAGQTDDAGTYPDTVRRGLHFLIANQTEGGRIAGPDLAGGAYEHAIATTALCEAYGLTRSPRYRDAAVRAVKSLQRVRNAPLGWRYERNGESDTSVTVWSTMALHAAQFAGIEVDPAAIKGARDWVEKATDPNFGHVGCLEPGGPSTRLEGAHVKRFPPEKTYAMTAAGMLVRIVAGDNPTTSDKIRQGADRCVEIPPKWDPGSGYIDMYYWYWGTTAMFQVGGMHWRKWNEAMVEATVGHQHPKEHGSRAGSWDLLCAWGELGGRVYSTALLTMCLEVYYRYDRLYGVK